MGPPSSGGTTVARGAEHPPGLPRRSGRRRPSRRLLYRYLEASRLAYADRNAYLGDPAFVDNPIAGLLSDRYAASARALIGPKAPTGPVAAGMPAASPPAGSSASVDQRRLDDAPERRRPMGNIVSYTFTIEQTGGNGIVVPGYGFLLNNELTDFDTASVTAPNRAAPAASARARRSPRRSSRKGASRCSRSARRAAPRSSPPCLQTLVNRIDLRHAAAGRARPRRARASATASTTEAESAFVDSPEGQRSLLNYWAGALPRARRRRDRRADRHRVQRQALQGGRRAGPPRRRLGHGRHADAGPNP